MVLGKVQRYTLLYAYRSLCTHIGVKTHMLELGLENDASWVKSGLQLVYVKFCWNDTSFSSCLHDSVEKLLLVPFYLQSLEYLLSGS